MISLKDIECIYMYAMGSRIGNRYLRFSQFLYRFAIGYLLVRLS